MEGCGLFAVRGYAAVDTVEIDGEADECFTRFASLVQWRSQRSTVRTKKERSNLLISTSLFVAASLMMSLIQGGGEIGRRSLSPKPHARARMGCWPCMIS